MVVPSIQQLVCTFQEQRTWQILFAAIEKCVFEDKNMTMDELIRACDTNFEGQERLRQLLLNKPEKYGNNLEHVDSIYKEMIHHIANTVQNWKDARGGHYAFGIDTQTLNLSHGLVTGALPDGRLAGEPFCDSASPMMGRDVNGPTATVKSVAAMGQEVLQEGALFNLRFDPKGVQGDNGPEYYQRRYQDILRRWRRTYSNQCSR